MLTRQELIFCVSGCLPKASHDGDDNTTEKKAQ